MKLRTSVFLLAAFGLSAPVFAQSTTPGPTSVNETGGQSTANSKAQGSGSQELNTNRSGTTNRSAGKETKQKAGGMAANTGASTGANAATGANIGATSTNEVSGSSTIPGVKPEGSGSGKEGAGKQANTERKAKNSAKGASTTGAGGTAGSSAGANIGATGTMDTTGNSNAGNTAQGSGSGNAERSGAAEQRSGAAGAPK